VANNRYASGARRKRQETTPRRQKNSPPPAPPSPCAPSQQAELIDNLNWLLSTIRRAAESPSGRALFDRLARLATSACIIDGLTLDSEGWAALLNLANGRSFAALKNRRKIPPHKPGQTLMFSAADLLRASVYAREAPRQKRTKESRSKS